MYKVLLLPDENGRYYYYNYVFDSAEGNIECETLPPYQDIFMARACYWTGSKWLYDKEKYLQNEKEYEEYINKINQDKKEAESIPTVSELTFAVMELSDITANIMDGLTEISLLVNNLLEGGDQNGEDIL